MDKEIPCIGLAYPKGEIAEWERGRAGEKTVFISHQERHKEIKTEGPAPFLHNLLNGYTVFRT